MTTAPPPDQQEAPEQVAAEAFLALSEGEWEGLVPLLDPDDVERFQAERLGWWDDAGTKKLTAEHLLRQDPEMPREVAEYQAERLWRHRERSVARQLAEFGVESTAQLQSLSAAEALTRYLRANDPATVARATLAEAGQELPAELSLQAMLTPRYRVLGSVPEGDDLAHVVYQMLVGPEETPFPPFPRIATLKRTPAGWRLGLTHDLFGMQGLGVSIGMDEDAEEE